MPLALSFNSGYFKVFRIIIIVLIIALAFLCSQLSIRAIIGEGGQVSEKTLGMPGSTGLLTVGRAGQDSGIRGLAMGAIVSTNSATGVEWASGGTTATLRGTLSNLNGFSNAQVWFEWGYDTSYGTSTAVQTAAVLGSYSATITGFDPFNTVYVRFVSSTDGIYYSSPVTFIIPSNYISNSYRMAMVLPIVWVCIIALAIFGLYSAGLPIILSVIFGAIISIIGTVGVQIVLSSLLNWW
jgi:hypothetical protein